MEWYLYLFSCNAHEWMIKSHRSQLNWSSSSSSVALQNKWSSHQHHHKTVSLLRVSDWSDHMHLSILLVSYQRKSKVCPATTKKLDFFFCTTAIINTNNKVYSLYSSSRCWLRDERNKCQNHLTPLFSFFKTFKPSLHPFLFHLKQSEWTALTLDQISFYKVISVCALQSKGLHVAKYVCVIKTRRQMDSVTQQLKEVIYYYWL